MIPDGSRTWRAAAIQARGKCYPNQEILNGSFQDFDLKFRHNFVRGGSNSLAVCIAKSGEILRPFELANFPLDV